MQMWCSCHCFWLLALKMLKTDKLLVLNIELPVPCAARELSITALGRSYQQRQKSTHSVTSLLCFEQMTETACDHSSRLLWAKMGAKRTPVGEHWTLSASELHVTPMLPAKFVPTQTHPQLCTCRQHTVKYPEQINWPDLLQTCTSLF